MSTSLRHIANMQRDMWTARRWARAWKKMAKDERAANDMLVPGWRWQSVRIAELERALRLALKQWELYADAERDIHLEIPIAKSTDAEGMSFRQASELLEES